MQRKAGTSADPELTSETIAFVYDADGHRTLKTRTRSYEDAPDKVETSKVYWSDWLPVCEEISVEGGTPSRRWFVWGQDVSGSWDGAGGIGGLLAIREEGGRTLLPVHDGLGNITALIHAGTGDTVATYDYAPFGEIVAESGEVNACPFRYQSKFYDVETGLSYFGFRYYSAKLGRWISRDPLGEEGGFNLYAYCGNDPVNGWDYLGMVEKQDVENATKAARDSLSVLGNLAVLIGSGLTEGESIELGGWGRAELLEAGAAAQEAYDQAVTDAMKTRADYLADMGMFEGLWDSNWDAANAPMTLPMTHVPSPRQLAWQKVYIENGGDAAAMLAESAGDAANTAHTIEQGATALSMVGGVTSVGVQGVKIFVAQGGKATLKYVGKVGASVAVGGIIDAGIGIGAEQLGIPPENAEAFRKGMALLGAMRTLNGLQGMGPANIRSRTGSSGELRSAFARISPGNIGQGTGTNSSSRAFVRRLGRQTDDAGHAVGQNLGGRGGVGGSRSRNIFPQSPNVNRGEFNQFEQEIASSVRAGNVAFIRVVARYHVGATRPHEVLYQVRINGKTISQIFSNP